ncbi:Eukaryotic translation initiation factor SUI1 [Penicillium herquei]|nr:Eukaryotic translation initiation factor SUI1 [Penicillium herquei]
MASNKDMRRADLVIPYVDPPKSGNEADMSSTLRTPRRWFPLLVIPEFNRRVTTGTMSSTMPMAAGGLCLLTPGLACRVPRTEEDCVNSSLHVGSHVFDGARRGMFLCIDYLYGDASFF